MIIRLATSRCEPPFVLMSGEHSFFFFFREQWFSSFNSGVFTSSHFKNATYVPQIYPDKGPV